MSESEQKVPPDDMVEALNALVKKMMQACDPEAPLVAAARDAISNLRDRNAECVAVLRRQHARTSHLLGVLKEAAGRGDVFTEGELEAMLGEAKRKSGGAGSQVRLDLRAPGASGATSCIDCSVCGVTSSFWYAVGDAVTAIKRVEQMIRDNPPDDWFAFRELWLVAGGAGASGLLTIADDPQVALSMFRGGESRTPYFLFNLQHQPSRKLLGVHLGRDLGCFGTKDLVA